MKLASLAVAALLFSSSAIAQENTRSSGSSTSGSGTVSSGTRSNGSSGNGGGAKSGGNENIGPRRTPVTIYPSLRIPNTWGNQVPMQTIPQETPSIPRSETVNQIAVSYKQEALTEIVKTMAKFSATPQYFEVKDVTQPFTIQGAKGFSVDFPEYAFTDAEGNPVLGEVTVEMREFTTNEEFAASGLTCLTSGNELLETGGMINLEAMSGEQKLRLAQGKTVTVNIPETATDKGFQTFYGARDGDVTKWSTTPPANNAADEEKALPFDGYTIQMMKPTMQVNGKPTSLFVYKNGEGLADYVNKNLKVSKDIREEIMKDGIPFLYTMEINMMGKVKNVKVKNAEMKKGSIISPLNKQIISLLEKAPPLETGNGNLELGKTYEVMFATVKNYTGAKPSIAPPMNSEFMKQVQVQKNPNASAVKEFSMESSSLSKINCDRFAGKGNAEDSIRFDFGDADALVYVVFKDMRSMISPNGGFGKYNLVGIPANHEVRYVAVVYDDAGNVKMGILEGNTKPGLKTFSNYTNFNAGVFKEALN